MTTTQPAEDLHAFAEQATLGGLLLTPDTVPVVARWLRPVDFIDHWHREVYAAILDRHPRPITAVDIGRDVVARLGGRRADLPRVHALLTATPNHPQPVRYARMVLETGIRHQTNAMAVLIQAGARLAGRAGNPRLLTDATQVVQAVLAADLTRWTLATHPDTESAEPSGPARVGEVAAVVIPDWRPLALAADRALTRTPAPDPALARQREQDLIAALITHPEAISRTSWLRPEMLSDRAWRTTYHALLDLAERGDPIDALTLAWETHRASPQHGPGPSLADLQTATDHSRSIDPRFTAISVAADTLDRLASHAVASIRAASTNPGLDIPDLLGTAQLMTTTLADLAVAAPHTTSTRVAPTRHPTTNKARGPDRSSPPTSDGSTHLRVVR